MKQVPEMYSFWNGYLATDMCYNNMGYFIDSHYSYIYLIVPWSKDFFHKID